MLALTPLFIHIHTSLPAVPMVHSHTFLPVVTVHTHTATLAPHLGMLPSARIGRAKALFSPRQARSWTS